MLRINLQPKVTVEAKAGFQLPIWAPILLGILVIAGIGGSYWYLNLTMNDLNSQKNSLTRKLKDFQELIKEEARMREDRDYLNDKLTYIRSISSNQAQWTYFFDTLKDNIPTDVWIGKLTVKDTGEFEVQGSTYSYSAIGHFILRLEAMPQLSSVALDSAAAKARGSAQEGDTLEARLRKDYKITAQTSMLGAASSAAQAKPNPNQGAKRQAER